MEHLQTLMANSMRELDVVLKAIMIDDRSLNHHEVSITADCSFAATSGTSSEQRSH